MQNRVLTSMRFETVHLILLTFCSVSIILFPKLVAFFFILLFLNLFYGFFKNKVQFKFDKTISLLVLFYFIYLIGCYFTKDTIQAGKYLEYKLSFLLLPFIFSFKLKELYSNTLLYKSFLVSLIILQLIQLFFSFSNYLVTGEFNSFYSSAFSFLHHPTYFSSYLLIGIGVLIREFKARISNRSFLLLLTYLLLGIFLSMSLSTLLLTSIIGLIFFMRFIRLKMRLIYFRFLLILTPFIFYFTLSFVPVLNTQFVVSKQYLFEYFSSPKQFISEKDSNDGGNIIRLIIWTATVYEIMEHPFGVGTGNVDFYLSKRLNEFNQKEMVKHFYNPHNQYLQTMLEIGVFGLFVLLLLLFQLFKFAYKRHDIILWFLVATLSFNSLFESMLQRQSGIVFYSFWICFLMIYPNSLKSLNKIE